MIEITTITLIIGVLILSAGMLLHNLTSFVVNNISSTKSTTMIDILACTMTMIGAAIIGAFTIISIIKLIKFI